MKEPWWESSLVPRDEKVSAFGATEGEATHRIIYFGRDVRKITGVFSVTLATLFDIRCGAFILVVRVNAGD